MLLSMQFTNFGPYHLARLRALAALLARSGDRLIAYETAGSERRYPWKTDRGSEPFEWVTLFPDRDLESLSPAECARGMRRALDRDRPDALAIPGYYRAELMAALGWANRHRRPAILMIDSQAIDYRRVWWKEAFKRRRVRRFSSALVAGPRTGAYMISLGIHPDRVAYGYDVVDNAFFAARAEEAREASVGRAGLPESPYFLAVCRFVAEKNLPGLVRAFARYRRSAPPGRAWDLVLCGDGPDAGEVDAAVKESGLAHAIYRPGFLQADALSRWYAFASAFVLPSLREPWGLVVNEAAAVGLPLLVTDRAGCSEVLVPDPPGTTGRRFDPEDEAEMADCLTWMAGLPEEEREAMGRRAAEVVSDWDPARFARGTLEALSYGFEAVGREKRPRSLSLTGK